MYLDWSGHDSRLSVMKVSRYMSQSQSDMELTK